MISTKKKAVSMTSKVYKLASLQIQSLALSCPLASLFCCKGAAPGPLHFGLRFDRSVGVNLANCSGRWLMPGKILVAMSMSLGQAGE